MRYASAGAFRTALEQRLNQVTEGPPGRPQRAFEAKAGQITPADPESGYPSESVIAVRSARIHKLQEQAAAKKKASE